MKPEVLVFAAVSADGFTEGFEVDQGAFYEIVQGRSEDVALAGSNTILAVPGADEDPDSEPDTSAFSRDGPLLAIIDSAGRIRAWDWLRRQPHWRDVIVIGSEATPRQVRAEWDRRGLHQIIVGQDKVDLAKAIEHLGSEFGASRIRIESGGTLNGLLLKQNLVDEVAMLVHPVVLGGRGRRTLLCGPEGARHDRSWPLKLKSATTLDGGLLHLTYAMDNASSAARATSAS